MLILNLMAILSWKLFWNKAFQSQYFSMAIYFIIKQIIIGNPSFHDQLKKIIAYDKRIGYSTDVVVCMLGYKSK